jgi:hypothetical protein
MSAIEIQAQVDAATATLSKLSAEIEAAEAKLATIKSTHTTEKFLASCRRAYQMARVHCDNPRHLIVCSWDAKKGHCTCKLASKITEHARDWRFVLDEMVPYEVAKCKCERDALQTGVSRNYPGMLANKWISQGATHVGVDKAGSSKRVMPLRYNLHEQASKLLQMRFPSWYFISNSILNHDHPIAHTSATMSSFYVMNEALPVGTDERPTTVIDVNGSPYANISRMKRDPKIKIHTVCKRHTPKDELRRAMKWGPKIDAETGDIRWHDLWDREIGAEGSTLPPQVLEDADATTMFHVLYYYSPSELEAYLSRTNRDHVIYATVHRHKETTGQLNGGEQTWKRNGAGRNARIIQTNTLTGESYEHAPVDWIFESNNKIVNRTHGITWDVNLICEETYLVRLKRFERATVGMPALTAAGAHCPECAHCEMKLPPTPSDDGQPEPNSDDWLRLNGTAVIPCPGGVMELEVPQAFHPVLNDMRRRMHGRQRTMQEYQSCLSMLRTKVKAREVQISTTLHHTHYVNMAQAVFWMDALHDIKIDTKLWDAHHLASVESMMLYTHGSKASGKMLTNIAIDMVQANSIRHASLAALLHLKRYAK